MFILLRYVGAAYLIWLGVALLRKGLAIGLGVSAHQGGGTMVSFLAGFALTLGEDADGQTIFLMSFDETVSRPRE